MGTLGQRGSLRLTCYAAATVQVVWVYLERVKTAFSLEAYEAGHSPVPFQYRLAMRPVLSWVHGSAAATRAATWLTEQHAWFPCGVRPEALVELPIDIAAVVITGCIAESIYARASRDRLLSGWVYPLMLAMVAIVFEFSTIHNLRFVYDLPAMAVFAMGLYALYTRQPLWRFALLFACGTVNRETTLLLLPAMLLQKWSAKRALLAGWVGWHVYVTRLFAGNVSAAGPRLLLNLGVLLCPLSWPQLGTFAGLCFAPLLYCRASQTEAVLWRWRLLIPIWFGFMLQYGLLIETRIFGELIAYMSPMVALAVERQILRRTTQAHRVITRTADALMDS